MYNLAVEGNSKHLSRLWAIVLLFCGVVLGGFVVGTISGIRRGDYTPVIAVTAGLAFAGFTVLRARRKKLSLFKETTPDRAIASYHSSMRRIPIAKGMVAYSSAFAAVLYGQFDRAREELASVNWSTLPPMYQGFEVYIHSLLAIFERHDYSRALNLAEEARDLCEVSHKFPGVRKSRAALDANVAVCELLMGKNSPELLGSLDRATKELPGVSPAIPAWALAVFYSKAGQQVAAEKYLAIVLRLLPHCAPLNDLRLGTRG